MWGVAKRDGYPFPPNREERQCETLFRFTNTAPLEEIVKRPWASAAVTADLQLVFYSERNHSAFSVRSQVVTGIGAETSPLPRLHCAQIRHHTHSSDRASLPSAAPPTQCWPTVAFLADFGPLAASNRCLLCVLLPSEPENVKKESKAKSLLRRKGGATDISASGPVHYTCHIFALNSTAATVVMAPLSDCVLVLPCSISSGATPLYVVSLARVSAPQLLETSLTWGSAQQQHRVSGLRRHAVGIISAWCRYVRSNTGAVELVLQTSQGQFLSFTASTESWRCTGVCSLTALSAEDVDQWDEAGASKATAGHKTTVVGGRQTTLHHGTHLLDVNAIDCAPSWRFTSRWLHSKTFTESLTEKLCDSELRNAFVSSLSFRCAESAALSQVHARKALCRSVRKGARVMATCGNSRGSVVLLSLASSVKAGGSYVLATIPFSHHNNTSGEVEEETRRYAPCVRVVLPKSDVNEWAFIADVTPVTADNAVGFVAIVSSGTPHHRLRFPSPALSRGSHRFLRAVFIPLSGLAMELTPVFTGAAMNGASRNLGPKASAFFADSAGAAKIAAVFQSNSCAGSTALFICTIVADLRAKKECTESAEHITERIQLTVELPDAASIVSELFRFVSSQRCPIDRLAELRTRTAALVSFSLVADFAFGTCRLPPPEAGSEQAATLDLSELGIDAYESVEGQPIYPTHATAVNSDNVQAHCQPSGAATVTPMASLALVQTLVHRLLRDQMTTKVGDPFDSTSHGLIQVFKGFSQALYTVRAGESIEVGHQRGSGENTNLRLLQGISASLSEGVDYLVNTGNVTGLLASLSFLAPKPPSPDWVTTHPCAFSNMYKLQAIVAPLFDASLPSILSTFPTLAEDVMPLCSDQVRSTIEAAQELLLRRSPLLEPFSNMGNAAEEPGRSAAGVAAQVPDRRHPDLGSLQRGAQRDIEFTAHRLFLEEGPRAALTFLHPLVNTPSCTESVKDLYHSYSKLHSRVEQLLSPV